MDMTDNQHPDIKTQNIDSALIKPDKLIDTWYVLYTKSRFESVVDQGLQKKSIESFLPKIKKKSKRRDRKVILNTPLFPGYLFVKTNLHPTEHLEILKTTGAVHLIGNKDGPVPVPEETIESLKIMISVEDHISTGNRLRKGDRVMVVHGPFTGVIGTFVHYRGKNRVVVHIEALGQYAGVEIDEEDIELLPEIYS